MTKKYFSLSAYEGAIVKRDSDNYQGFLFLNLKTCIGFVFISDRFVIAVHHIGLPTFDYMIDQLKFWNFNDIDQFGEIEKVLYLCNTQYPKNIKSEHIIALSKTLDVDFKMIRPVLFADEQQIHIAVSLTGKYGIVTEQWIHSNTDQLFNFPQTLSAKIHYYHARFLFYASLYEGMELVETRIGSSKTYLEVPARSELPAMIQDHMTLFENGDKDRLLNLLRQERFTGMFDLDLGEDVSAEKINEYYCFLTKLLQYYRLLITNSDDVSLFATQAKKDNGSVSGFEAPGTKNSN